MSEQQQNLPEKRVTEIIIKMPEIFYSSATGRMFEKCMVCERDLFAASIPYFIEKAIKNYKNITATDTLFEYVMCEDCYFEALKMYSAESRQRIENYYETRVDLQARHNLLLQNTDEDISRWIDRCFVKNKQRTECDEYQIFCECVGRKAVLSFSPIMICDEVAADLIKLLSDKTKDDIGRFKEQYFDLPPELKINPKQPEILLF